jgi:hypothetical protein
MIEEYPPEVKSLFLENPVVEDVLNAYQEILLSDSFAMAMYVNTAMCLIVVILGVGVWMLSEWWRKATITFFIIAIPIYVWTGFVFFSSAAEIFEKYNLYMLLYVYNKFPLTAFFTVLNFVLLAVNAAVITYYFKRPDVKKFFGKR